IPAYSPTYGNAFGASANGDGTWTTAVGGPGGNLNRNHYKEFSVTATSGSVVRIDSLILNAAFYNTSSNTKLAIVFSKSGFTINDSTDISGGTGPGNIAVTGSFASPILLANQTGGPTNIYRLAFAGTTGININGGETLTIRMYMSCGSTGTPRYAMMKNVIIKGEANAVVPVNLVSFNAKYVSKAVHLNWKTTNEVNTQEFLVEKSNDGINYIAIGKVISKNTSGINNYQFQDPAPAKGINYYRLKIVDIGTGFAYSKVETVSNDTREIFSIYTNPVADQLILNYLPSKPGAMFTILTADGKEVLKSKPATGSIQTYLNIRRLTPGIYVILYYDGDEKRAITFMKQ
ncbi:MAG TPA: T9SS type A sorting domain-containing protein, partial [Ferruginibacter sp.]|nr:T9SS type A sorting domain-containing protein [Ferruginibacter sp.]